MRATKMLSVRAFADEYGLDVRIARRAVRAGQVPSVRIGCRDLIPRAALERVMACEEATKHIEEEKAMPTIK
jgi:hypothetical protein